jgi:hypothetical protein
VRSGRGALAAVAVVAVAGVAACDGPGAPADLFSRPSEVSGRVWFCTPGRVHGGPGEDKGSASAVTIEIVAAPPRGAGGRYPPDTVLGRATDRLGERWAAGTVHELPIAWVEPGVDRSALDRHSVRVRVTRRLDQVGPFRSLDAWAFSFFLSFDVVSATDTGEPVTDWHLDATSTDYVVAPPDRQELVDAEMSELRGWPHPCPRS